MKTDEQMVKELNDLNIQIYKLKGTEIVETCTNEAYYLQFDSIKQAYNFHLTNIKLNK